jgi:hypothetical protein
VVVVFGRVDIDGGGELAGLRRLDQGGELFA